MGQIIENVDPFSFQIIGNAYAKDYQHVFQYGQIVETLQPPSCQPPTNYNSELMTTQPMHMDTHMCMPIGGVPTPPMTSYEVRDFKVFFGNEYVPDARWIDFTNLGQGYGMYSPESFY